ncbi:MAG: beta-N-acetylhexosaminidase [Thermoproteales archaeon]|nr:beta-N-acetylhexosaminidase [Thermoproteales archaeon]
MEKCIEIIPEPKQLRFTGRWFDFNGFKNFPSFLVEEFGLETGDWVIKPVEEEGTGVRVKDGVIEYWGDEKNCYATIIQLVKQCKGKLPEVEIKEEFCFEFRGFHLDIARGAVPKVDTFKRILRWLFLLKYNYFAIYFEDLFPWEKYPEIGAERGRLTVEEWNTVVEYGAKLGIEVFPSLELAGHMENILTLPAFRKYSEWYRPSEGCLNVFDEEARNFAKDLLKEALEKTVSKYIHIGGDETWALGRGRSLDKTLEFKGPQLYADHHSDLINIVRSKGKIPLLWGDMLAGMYLRKEEKELWEKILEKPVWRNVVIANWDYSPRPIQHFREKIKLFKEKGYRQIACPGLWNWRRYYPNFENALTNLKNFLQAAKEEKVMGFMVTAWGDDGEECLFSFLDPLILAAMEYAEGNGKWEEKWMALTGEDEKVLEARKLFGRPEIADFIKPVLFLPSAKIKEVPVLKFWEEVIRKLRNVTLPRDLAFIKRFLEVALKKIKKKALIADFIGLSSTYTELWLNERKYPGLEKIVSRFWSAAAMYDLYMGSISDKKSIP